LSQQPSEGGNGSDDEDSAARLGEVGFKQLLSARTEKRSRARTSIPSVLPAELLTDSSSEDEDEVKFGAGHDSRKPKKREISNIEKRFALQTKRPRDKRTGGTVYRVMKKQTPNLAPKAALNSLDQVQRLMARNRPAIQQHKGFFRKK
jgi:U3 small nucleolar RNA-associated protein 16